MQLHLSCGALGRQATQRQAADLAPSPRSVVGPVRVERFNDGVRHMTPDDAAAAAMSGLKKAFSLV